MVHRSTFPRRDAWHRRGYNASADSPRPFSLPNAMRSGNYVVLPQGETIDERSCQVVREANGVDKLWLDPERGFAIVKRELRWERNGSLMARYHNADFPQGPKRALAPRGARLRESFFDPALHSEIVPDTLEYTNVMRVDSIHSGDEVPAGIAVRTGADSRQLHAAR